MFCVSSHTIFALLKAIVDKSDREKFLPVQKCLSVEKHIYRMKNKFRRTRNIFAGREIFLSNDKFLGGREIFLPVEKYFYRSRMFLSVENILCRSRMPKLEMDLGLRIPGVI